MHSPDLSKLPKERGAGSKALAELLQALDQGQQAVGLFDDTDSLVYANSIFREAWCLGDTSSVDAEKITFSSMIARCHANRCGAIIDTDNIEAWLRRANERRREGPAARAFEVDFWDGRWFWVSECRTADGWILDICHDITSLKHSEKKLGRARDAALRDSLTDALTRLPNRRGAFQRLEELIDERKGFSIALIDLVHFKQINDSYGHIVGDAVLREFSRRVLDMLPGSCSAARLAGDEFIVIGAPELSRDAFTLVVAELLGRQRAPFAVMGHSLDIGVSIGIASAPTDADEVGELLGAADEAMYRAKQSGRYGMRAFDPQMGEARREQAALRRDLWFAFARQEFEPYYQPVVDLQTGALIKFEILARWAHPARGLLTPDRFLPVFETTDQWNALTEALLRRAGRDFRDAAVFPRISFNVAAQQLKRDGIVSILKTLEAEKAIPIDRLEMEVTESALISSPAEAKAVVDAVRTLGLSTALDDFGVGFSSLKHLRELRFDRLKLDRSFVIGIVEDTRSQIFVGAVIDLARRLGLSVIVEGVEDQHTADALAALGCNYGQGFLFGRPVPAKQALKWHVGPTAPAPASARPGRAA